MATNELSPLEIFDLNYYPGQAADLCVTLKTKIFQ